MLITEYIWVTLFLSNEGLFGNTNFYLMHLLGNINPLCYTIAYEKTAYYSKKNSAV